MWLANLADLELHTSLALAEDVKAPTLIAFDLDPGPPATIVECAEVALRLREAFDHLGLEAFPKTSGSKGMQVYVPLNTPTTYDETKPFARALAQVLERRHPKLVLSDMSKQRRTGKVFVDWSQNDEHKTTVNVYSLRARERPTVSTPLSWDEVEDVERPRGAQLHLGRGARAGRRARRSVRSGRRAAAGVAGGFLRVLNRRTAADRRVRAGS